MNWREEILKELTSGVTRLTLVADPDGLLSEEGVLEIVQERKFDLIQFEDPVAFRYEYEFKHRSRWENGEEPELVVVVKSQASALGELPYDLLLKSRVVSFAIADIFPNLSNMVVAALDRGDLDALYEAQTKYSPRVLGEKDTRAFVLRHVFEIAPELIKQPSDLLRVLLRRHYSKQKLPAILNERFIQLLEQGNRFRDWPLEKLITDREAFFAFLQERWPIFLDRISEETQHTIQKENTAYGLKIDGPIEVPFDHDDIRVYIDNLFMEGILHPIFHPSAHTLAGKWVAIGVRTKPLEDRSRRMGKLLESIRTSLPAVDSRYIEWIHFARKWAEMVVLTNEEGAKPSEDTCRQIDILQLQVDLEFTAWLIKRYKGLVSLSAANPVMLHQVARYLAHRIEEDNAARVALLVFDGLSFDQWLVVREVLESFNRGYVFREEAVFAWVPSITSVSRQAIFAGKPPIYFPKSIEITAREESLWRKFWVDQGLLKNEILYMKGLGEGNLENIKAELSNPRIRAAGMVVDMVDKIMHGMELGISGMHNQVRQWSTQPYIANVLDLLMTHGFQVYLTSDHGNIEAKGCGRPAEGAIADVRSQRVRVFPDASLRNQVKIRFPDALEWEPIGLPDSYFPLIAPSRKAFLRVAERMVTHGGIHLEELIVPFVHIERDEQ